MLKLMTTALLLISAPAFSASAICEKSSSLDALIECLQREVSKAEAELARYLDASRKHHADNRLALYSVESTQGRWSSTQRFRCSAAGIYPRDADKLSAQRLLCIYQDTREQTHLLWRQFLTNPNGSPPVLPEPGR